MNASAIFVIGLVIFYSRLMMVPGRFAGTAMTPSLEVKKNELLLC